MNLNTYLINRQIKHYSAHQELSALSVRPYIPFFSLLNNESLGYPYPEESPGSFTITGNKFAAEMAINFRLHPIFSTIRRAEIALRRNNLDGLLPDNLLQDVTPEHLSYLDNIDLMGNSFYECLLTLAVVYRNTKAVELLLNTYDISPDKGMEAALGENNPHMVNLLLSHGASTGTHLHTELLKWNPSEQIVRILLHYGANKSLKLGNTGNNALSCALKIQPRTRKPFLELLSSKQIRLTNSEIKKLEKNQTPDYRYSIEYVREHGNELLDHISDKNSESLDAHIDALIKEMSEDSFKFIVTAYIIIQRNDFRKFPHIRKTFESLRAALLHPNFQIPEYDHLFIKALTGAHPNDRNKLLHIIASLNTELGKEKINRVTRRFSTGVYGRMQRGENAFLESHKIEYPDTFEEIEPVEVDSKGFLLCLTSCGSYELSEETLNAFSKLTETLIRGEVTLSDVQLKKFIGSILAEVRYDIRLRGLWCLYKNDSLPSEEWHEHIHLASIMAVAWSIYLYQKKSEWIEDIYSEYLLTTGVKESKQKLQEVIDNALMKLSRLKLHSNRHGGMFTLYAVKLLTSVGIHGYLDLNHNRRFKELLDKILRDYREMLTTNEPIIMSERQRFSPSIAIIGEVDVTDRVKKLLDATP